MLTRAPHCAAALASRVLSFFFFFLAGSYLYASSDAKDCKAIGSGSLQLDSDSEGEVSVRREVTGVHTLEVLQWASHSLFHSPLLP